MKIIIVTGMPGAGKSEVADAFQEVSHPVIVMGDVVRKEAERRGLAADPTNTKKIMLELRERDGLGAIAKFCLNELKELTTDIVIIEGCRSLAEVDVFDDYASSVDIVCVHSSPKTRFERLRKRNRDDAPPDWSNFRERDLRELSIGLGGVIAMADIMIVNEGTLEELKECIQGLLESYQ